MLAPCVASRRSSAAVGAVVAEAMTAVAGIKTANKTRSQKASSFMRRQVNVLHCTKPSLACLAREFPAALA